MVKLKVLELFCGTKSISKEFEKVGYKIFTVDFDKRFNPDLCVDILDIDYDDLPNGNDVVWASPPCQCFSVASIGTHWGCDILGYKPQTENAKEAIKILEKTIDIIYYCKPKYWFIENPRGMMRKIIPKLFKKNKLFNHYNPNPIRHTVTYCQYGDKRMKPTDIWTNNDKWIPKKMCKNGNSCHISAPRGAKTGTQGLKDSVNRSIIPKNLCKEIVEVVQEVKN